MAISIHLHCIKGTRPPHITLLQTYEHWDLQENIVVAIQIDNIFIK